MFQELSKVFTNFLNASMKNAHCENLCICLKRDRMTHEYMDKDMSNLEFHWKILKNGDFKYERFIDVNIRKLIWSARKNNLQNLKIPNEILTALKRKHESAKIVPKMVAAPMQEDAEETPEKTDGETGVVSKLKRFSENER